MPTIFQQCDEEVSKIVEKVMRDYHGDLVSAGVTVEALFAFSDSDAPLKRAGVPAIALIKVTSLEWRTQGHADCRIKIDGAKWQEMSGPERTALIDHELEHMELCWKETSQGRKLKRDDLGRPKLRARVHDWELAGFNSILERHGMNAPEVSQMVRFLEERSGQMVMEFLPVESKH